MKLIIGLGNPEEKYFSTRHNFGFRVVDAFQAAYDFPEFKLEKKFKAEISEGRLNNEKIYFVKPQTFMNLSGETAAALLNFFKPAVEDFLVVYDDVDLDFGVLRIREGGSSGGHNGVKSLIQHFGTKNFARMRLGIANDLLDVMPTEEFVLAKFSKDEEIALSEIRENAVAAIADFLENGLESSMNKFNS